MGGLEPRVFELTAHGKQRAALQRERDLPGLWAPNQPCHHTPFTSRTQLHKIPPAELHDPDADAAKISLCLEDTSAFLSTLLPNRVIS